MTSQTRYNAQYVATSAAVFLVVVQWNPELSIAWVIKPRRRDAHDLMRCAVQLDSAPQHVAAAAQPLLPKRMPDHHHTGATRHVLFGADIPAQMRSFLKHVQKSVGDMSTPYGFSVPHACQR